MSVTVIIIIYVIVMIANYAFFKMRAKKSAKIGSSNTIFTKIDKGKGKRNGSIILRRAYTRLSEFPLTRNYTRSLAAIFEPYNPGDAGTTKSMVVITETVIFVIATIILAVAVMISVSPYVICCSVILIFVASREIVASITKKINRKILHELGDFIDLLQFNYMQTNMVDEAIRNSITGKNKTVEKHARKILAILDADDTILALEKYMTTVRNGYLRELLCICVVIHLYGDSQDDNLDAFAACLSNLEKRVSDEYLRLDELQFAFRGKTLMVIPPLILGEALRRWACNDITELEPYLRGFYGFMASIINILVVLAAYLVMSRLSSDGSPDTSRHELLVRISELPFVNQILTRYYTKNYGKSQQITRTLKQLGSRLTVYSLTAKRIVFAVVTFIATIILIVAYTFITRYRVVNTITGTGAKSTGATETVSVEMLMLSRAYTDKYLEQDVVELYRSAGGNSFYIDSDVKSFLKDRVVNDMKTSAIEISSEQAYAAIYQYNEEYSNSTKLYTKYLGTADSGPLDDGIMYDMGIEQLNDLVAEASQPDAIGIDIFYDSIADDVVSAVCGYQNSFFHWYWLILAFVLAFVAFQLPVIWLRMGKDVSQQLMESEVMQFQSLFVIMQLLANVSESDVMDWMLRFSTVFREGLHRCIVNYPMENSEAIEKLINAETFEPFQNLMRKVQMCDKVGIHKAFADMTVIQDNYTKQVTQRRNHRLRSAISNSELWLMLPWIAMEALYLLIPLVIEAMGEFDSMLSTLVF